MKKLVLAICLCAAILGCESKKQGNDEVQSFLDQYNKTYQAVLTASSEAQWQSNIKIVEGDSTNTVATRKANEAYADFTGSEENIEKIEIEK